MTSRFFSRWDVMRTHWPFAIVAALGLALVLTNLGSDYLWADEGDTAVLASNILKFGVPKAWDGVTFIDSDRGARDNDELVMVSHPWVQYYVAAASFLAFGENTFAARLPFALAGWMTIVLVYVFLWRISANRWAAFCAAALMLLSVQFLLYSRQCRNYSLNMLFTCWLFWIFYRMKSASYCLWFAFAAILLFHTHPIGLVPVGVLGILTLIYRPFAPQRRWFWYAAPGIAIFTLPWFALARTGYAENTATLRSLGQFVDRLIQYVIESASVTPLIGCILLLIVFLMQSKLRNRKIDRPPESTPARKFLKEGEAALLLVTFATLFFYALVMAATQSSYALWRFGLRYTPGMIPLMAMIAGILISKIGRERSATCLTLLLLFGLTKLPQLTPWAFAAHSPAMHIPEKVIDRFVCTEQALFLRDFWHENPGVIAKTCEFLGTYAKPADRVLANYCWEPLFFHTRLPQELKILPEYPIYEAARRKKLPEYVFHVDRARWVVWRPYWEGYQGYRWEEVQRQILDLGGHLRLVAEIEETVWENREDIHFRRFSGSRYLVRSLESAPAALIFRVDWPD